MVRGTTGHLPSGDCRPKGCSTSPRPAWTTERTPVTTGWVTRFTDVPLPSFTVQGRSTPEPRSSVGLTSTFGGEEGRRKEK